MLSAVGRWCRLLGLGCCGRGLGRLLRVLPSRYLRLKLTGMEGYIAAEPPEPSLQARALMASAALLISAFLTKDAIAEAGRRGDPVSGFGSKLPKQGTATASPAALEVEPG